jgi:tRNA 5-methylaminomethyl-2-thiouridine biosynthesis bifunctional protein
MDGIKPIRIGIKDVRTPFAPLFDDIYFSAEDGIKESEYVYLEGTGFLNSLGSAGARALSIGEIGFGVGLNFILTLKAFSEQAAASQRLTYFSVEKFPVVKEDLQDLYSRYPELQPYANDFLAQYPVLTPGMHSLKLLRGRVTLILMLGEATEMFSAYDGKANFWYWDGFAPSKNPDAFSAPLFAQVARLSHPQAQGSSFTAAGWVRRGLETAGFTMRKRVGYGKKRECIVGNYSNTTLCPELIKPWFSPQKLKLVQAGQKIAVLGAGLSGSAIAWSLAERGHAVSVYDPNGIATRASGNSIGLYNVQLSKMQNPISRFTQSALSHFIQEVKNRGVPVREGIDRTGDPAKIENSKICLENSQYPEDFYELKERAVHFSQCGMLRPSTLCELRVQAHGDRVSVIQKAVIEIKRTENSKQGLKLHLSDHSVESYDHVIYATGADHSTQGLQDSPLSELPVRAVRGQLIEVRASEKSLPFKNAKVQLGYVSPVAPEISGHFHHVIGATYLTREPRPDQTEIDTEFLIAEAKKKWPEFSELTRDDFVLSQVSHRLSTPDKLPVIGPAFSATKFEQDYGRVLRGTRVLDLPALTPLVGEWILSGMGSRGITYSSLGAELLASLMCGEALPLERDLFEHLHSARFLMRQLKKPKNKVD